MDKATEQFSQRQSELEELQEQLAEAPFAEDEVSYEGEDKKLEPEFRGNVDVVRLHRQLDAAKSSVRSGGRPKVAVAKMEVDVGLSFEGDDISAEILKELGAATGASRDTQRLANKSELAQFVQKCSRKKLRTAQYAMTGIFGDALGAMEKPAPCDVVGVAGCAADGSAFA